MNIQEPPPRTSDPAPMRMVYPMDTVGKALIYSLRQPTEPPLRNAFVRAIGQQGRIVEWGFAGLWVALVALAALLICILTDGSMARSFSWIFAIDSAVFQAFIIFCIWYARYVTRRFPDGVKKAGEVSVRSLRRAALIGNNVLAPTVEIAPGDDVQVALVSESGAATLTVMPPEWRLLRGTKIVSGAGIASFVGLGVLEWLVGDSTSGLPWDVVTFYPLLIILCLGALIYSIRRSRAFRVTLGADGLHWRKQMLPWSEVHGWYVLYLHPLNTSWTHPNAVYALVGQHASLAWLAYPQSIESNNPGKRLAQLVQAHIQTHGHETLPLRDLTPGAVAISYQVSPRLFWWGRLRLLAADDHSLVGSPLPRLPGALLTFLLAVLVLLGAIFTQNLQQWYFGGQLAQMEAARTALRDPMTANTLQWTTAPVYGNHSTFTFTPQGYIYPAEECCGASSLIAPPVSDGLVEMTLRQQAAEEFDGAGIVFRANSHARIALVFFVTPDGNWRLDRYTMGPDGTFSESDFLRTNGEFFGVSAIHQGHDVTNRLAVLMQGSAFTFFINGQFVGRYWSTDLPQSGQVGVYTNGYQSTVTFSDLLISPA